jgi:hypothetical protein
MVSIVQDLVFYFVLYRFDRGLWKLWSLETPIFPLLTELKIVMSALLTG